MSSGHARLAEHWLAQGRHDRAVDELRLALAQDPDDATLHARLAFSLYQLDREREALPIAETAVGLAPDWPFAHFVHGCVLSGLKRLDEADASIRRAIALDGDEAAYYGALANVALGRRRWRDAVGHAEAGLAIDPEDADCLNARALALVQLGDPAAADRGLEAALRNDPEDARTHATMGWSLLNQGRPHDAIAHYREALRLEPGMEWARSGMVEAMKARNIVYRLLLKIFLYLARIDQRVAFGLIIGSVFARVWIRNAAESAPALGLVLWPLYYALLALILAMWLAGPVFNLLLRLDRDGRLALDRQQRIQSDVLLGLLAATAVCAGFWLGGVVGMGMATILCAMLILPATATAGKSSRRGVAVFGAWTLALAGLAVAIVLAYRSVETERLQVLDRVAAIDKPEEMDDARWKQLPPAERLAYNRRMEKANAEVAALDAGFKDWKARKDRQEGMLMLFVLGWVAFTWVSSLASARGW